MYTTLKYILNDFILYQIKILKKIILEKIFKEKKSKIHLLPNFCLFIKSSMFVSFY